MNSEWKFKGYDVCCPSCWANYLDTFSKYLQEEMEEDAKSVTENFVIKRGGVVRCNSCGAVFEVRFSNVVVNVATPEGVEMAKKVLLQMEGELYSLDAFNNSLELFKSGESRVFYGEGGYSRYIIRKNGNLVFLASFGTDNDINKAKHFGLTVE